jgi:hypothetical protein
MVLTPTSLALISQYRTSELIPLMEKDATDERGNLTLHSAIKYLTKEMLIKHAQHTDTLMGLALLEACDND